MYRQVVQKKTHKGYSPI